MRGDRVGRATVQYWPTKKRDREAEVHSEFSAYRDYTAVAELEALTPSTEYAYRLQTDGCEPGPEYSFTTLPPEGRPGRIRFVTAGDINGGSVPGFDDIAEVTPDFVLMVGDNVYADGFGMSADVYRERYLKVWQGSQFQALFSHVAAFATWDDHELVDNYWDGKNDAVYDFASKLYDDFQGSRNPEPLVPGERYYAFHAADIGFFVLDTRTHRSPNKEPDSADKSMLGGPQKAALLAWLANDRSRVHILLSSVLMSPFSTTGNDSWTAFAIERDEILEAIAVNRPENLFVVSGDQHWSAVIRLDHDSAVPYTVYEFQATPLAFAERGAPDTTSDAVLALDNNHRVFGVFDVDTLANPPQLHYSLCVVGTACDPHQEPYPSVRDGATTVPYSVHFEGTADGFRLLNE
jgi:alkaline phosphatase D